LADYRRILARIYDPGAYYDRVEAVLALLNPPDLDRSRSADPPPRHFLGIERRDFVPGWRLFWRVALRQPGVFPRFCRIFLQTGRRNPLALRQVGVLAALYLHLGPFSRHVISLIDQEIAAIDAVQPAPAAIAEAA
jgi:hypothetical protein